MFVLGYRPFVNRHGYQSGNGDYQLCSATFPTSERSRHQTRISIRGVGTTSLVQLHSQLQRGPHQKYISIRGWIPPPCSVLLQTQNRICLFSLCFSIFLSLPNFLLRFCVSCLFRPLVTGPPPDCLARVHSIIVTVVKATRRRKTRTAIFISCNILKW